jgi:chromosome segregation protein
MSLSKITISGFKTFSEKTVIDFSQGINIIVGPNGCGKSNLVDAIKWVLGASKQKMLRSAEPLDVIFSGNNNKKAANLCKVELELAGC